jgi:hypothetical protein
VNTSQRCDVLVQEGVHAYARHQLPLLLFGGIGRGHLETTARPLVTIAVLVDRHACEQGFGHAAHLRMVRRHSREWAAVALNDCAASTSTEEPGFHPRSYWRGPTCQSLTGSCGGRCSAPASRNGPSGYEERLWSSLRRVVGSANPITMAAVFSLTHLMRCPALLPKSMGRGTSI